MFEAHISNPVLVTFNKLMCVDVPESYVPESYGYESTSYLFNVWLFYNG